MITKTELQGHTNLQQEDEAAITYQSLQLSGFHFFTLRK
jgi:hypothetical protein